MSKSNQQKSRRSLLLLLLAFILPVLLAKLALENQWFDYGVTNQGDLMEQPMTLEDIGLDQQEKWLVIYSLPENCDNQCLQTLKGIENTYFALGRETPRVTPVALSHSPFNAQQLNKLNAQHWQILDAPAAALQTLSVEQIYVSDPLGNIVIRYQRPDTEADISSFGKAMLGDLKKLLKYSRIG